MEEATDKVIKEEKRPNENVNGGLKKEVEEDKEKNLDTNQEAHKDY